MDSTTPLYTNTRPIDREKVTQAITKLYSYCVSKENAKIKGRIDDISRTPEVIFVQSPTELESKMTGEDKDLAIGSYNDIAHFVNRRGFGRCDLIRWGMETLFWTAMRKADTCHGPYGGMLFPEYYMYPYDANSKFPNRWEELACAVWDECIMCLCMRDKVYVAERPVDIKTNDDGYHCADGPAIVWRDGTEDYFYKGRHVTEKHIKHPEQLTLDDVHNGNSKKHLLIELMGVDRYIQLIKAHKVDVKGKMKKFFQFASLETLPDDAKEDWKKKSKGWMYKENPYTVRFHHKSINGKHYFCMESQYDIYAFPSRDKGLSKCKAARKLFKKGDLELWDMINVEKMMSKSSGHNFTLSFQNGEYRLKVDNEYNGGCCYHDVAPAYFKTMMMKGEDCFFVNDKVRVLYDAKEDKIGVETDYVVQKPLFHGVDNIPFYRFNVDIRDTTWEGLLQKWADLCFDWLVLHEDSSCAGAG